MGYNTSLPINHSNNLPMNPVFQEMSNTTILPILNTSLPMKHVERQLINNTKSMLMDPISSMPNTHTTCVHKNPKILRGEDTTSFTSPSCFQELPPAFPSPKIPPDYSHLKLPQDFCNPQISSRLSISCFIHSFQLR
jgi:hypothetical protein